MQNINNNISVLITGIEGFVGRHLVEFFLKEERRIEIHGGYFDKDSLNIPYLREKLRRLFFLDVTDKVKVEETIREIRPNWIVNLSAISHVGDSFRDPSLTFTININGVYNILEAIRKISPSSRMLYIGSCDEYGMVKEEELPIKEKHPFRPQSPYAVSKISGEMLSYQYYNSFGLDIVIARPFNHTGVGQSDKFVVSQFARHAAEIELGLRDKKMSIGNVSIERDFSDVRDIVRAYCLLLKQGRKGETYNISMGRSISINEILNKIISFVSHDVEIRKDKTKLRKNEVKRIYGCNEKIKKEVGWHPEIMDLGQTFRDIYEWWIKFFENRPRD